MNYKKIFYITFVALLAFAIISPSMTLAISTQDLKAQRDAEKEEMQAQRDAKKEEMQTQRTEKTCAMIFKQGEQIQARLTERISNLAQKRITTEAQIKQRIEARIATRTQKRNTWEKNRATNWEKLRSKAETDEQKAAVEKFIQEVQSAVKIKNAGIDNIVSSFKAAIQTENNARKGEIDSQITDYQSAVAAIISQIKADCASGKDAKEIREYFKTEMQKARNEFQTQRKTVEKFRDEIAPLKETKKSEMRAIIETFKNSIEKAKTELRATFPAASESN